MDIALGMEVMVTSNVSTDLDVANGDRGHVVDIVLQCMRGNEHCAPASLHPRVNGTHQSRYACWPGKDHTSLQTTTSHYTCLRVHRLSFPSPNNRPLHRDLAIQQENRPYIISAITGEIASAFCVILMNFYLPMIPANT